MKTCIILEINNGKAIVLFPDGEISEVRAHKDWEVGQTVSPSDKTKKVKPLFVAAACLLLVFVVIIPFAGGQMTTSDSDPQQTHIAVGNPSVVANKMETADEDYTNVFDIINAPEIVYSESMPMESESFNLFSPEPTSDSAGSTEMDSSYQDKGGSEDSADFSETNIQVKGVQEADIVKTDGNYIYALNSKNLVVLEANNGEPKIASKLKQDSGEGKYYEMYLEEDALIALKNAIKTDDEDNEKPFTEIDIFDVSDPQNPEKVKSLSQSGDYSDSRMVGGFLYLITNYDLYDISYKKSDHKTYIPEFITDDNSESAAAKDIIICPAERAYAYTVIGSIDVQNPDGFADTKSILGDMGNVFASLENIYIAIVSDKSIKSKEKGMTASTEATDIIKIGFKDGMLSKVKSAKIPGIVLNQFSMDEYEGNFRVVTEAYWDAESKTKPSGFSYEYDEYDEKYYAYGNYTALFTLDEDLEELGSIINIAPDENLYSCRFMDDYAYFVTFKQVDPLFAADLSDPENPQIVGKLKIPGFSEYLHPYDDGLLLGLGSDADENTGRVGSLKLSMFDNSDPENISEKHTHIIKGHDFTEASENHKAILVDSEKKLIAFPAGGTYLVFTYDNKSGFEQIAEIKYDDSEYEYLYTGIRGLFIANDFYVITPNLVKTFDIINDFGTIAQLKINTEAEAINKYDFLYEDVIME